MRKKGRWLILGGRSGVHGLRVRGPSGNVRVTVTPALSEKMYPDKIPLNVRLYLTEEFKSYRAADSGKTLGVTYDFWNLGSESAGMREA